MSKRVLYLGPEGSYSELVIDKFKKLLNDSYSLEQRGSIYAIMQELSFSKEESLYAVVPIENSIEGIVSETQDNLCSIVKNGYQILAEAEQSINHSLISFYPKEEIEVIISHSQALAQCRNYIYNNWGANVVLKPTLSTSSAIASLKSTNEKVAAIGNVSCANYYSVPVVEENVNDEKNNTTRFLLLSRSFPQNVEQNKISITFSTENKPGALNKILSILEKSGINMTNINSRPSRHELGEYVFYVDFEGHINDTTISTALLEIEKQVKTYTILSCGAVCL